MLEPPIPFIRQKCLATANNGLNHDNITPIRCGDMDPAQVPSTTNAINYRPLGSVKAARYISIRSHLNHETSRLVATAAWIPWFIVVTGVERER
jgi:hypothetical protein